MNIGFDAKRAFHNNTGLGNYSRTLIDSLRISYPEHQYFLFNPKATSKYKFPYSNTHEILPSKKTHQFFSSIWRRKWMLNDIKKNKIDLYHGLSHELPIGIEQSGIQSIVTIHDLIYLRYPNQFNPIDVRTYDRKFRSACKASNHIIAISEQTKKDIVSFFGVDENKITVCYQSCDAKYNTVISEEEKAEVRKTLQLPENYFLYVGSIIERKNLKKICEAMVMLKGTLSIPLVVIGNGKRYKQEVQQYIKEKGIESSVIFLSDQAYAQAIPSFRNGDLFPAIYQMAAGLIYPSYFEGFGIPILEALFSGCPVITSSVSCLPEAGGEGAIYVNPDNADEIANGMKKLYFDEDCVSLLKKKGAIQAQKFTQAHCAKKVMEVYQSI
jgi:glycosyltransferase involved in cell wall biosynthesis